MSGLQHCNPEKVIYIGEESGGCCEIPAFFEYMEEYYDLVENVTIPQWSYIYDQIYLFKRK